ncbi:unnamed protein product [Cochlearia groenlandica]
MVEKARQAKLPPPEGTLNCPRCDSTNTKFCYYNNYNFTQPRYFCKGCRRYWTRGGTLRNVPVGGGCRKNNKKGKNGNSKSKQTSSSSLGNTPSPSLGQIMNRANQQFLFQSQSHNYNLTQLGGIGLNLSSTNGNNQTHNNNITSSLFNELGFVNNYNENNNLMASVGSMSHHFTLFDPTTTGIYSFQNEESNDKKPMLVRQDIEEKLPKNVVDKDENHISSGFMKQVTQNSSVLKLGIKSFRVPELFIEIPETSTIGSLKRTVMETLTTILGDGLHIGVNVHGKKVRDDNKLLLNQSGTSLDNLSDTIEFCLEPNPCNVVSNTLTRLVSLITLVCHTKPNSCVESDIDSRSSVPNKAKTVYSRALVPFTPLHAQALTIVPPRKPKRSEVAQRRIRRPFSVSEVEALVQAVERLGTGRWRDVKMRAFEYAKHRTYVDLKDKWKTLVHTARISPQQRRGEPVPQELLDRVLTAHAYWSHQQGKQQFLEGPHKLETSLGL